MRWALVLLCTFARIAVADPVSALISHESTEVGNDGVTRTARYQERLARDGDQLWIERVMAARPARTLHDLDVRTAARWYTRHGAHASVVLVSTQDRVIIELGPASLESQDLPDRWVIAAELVDRTGLVATARAAAPGTRWYERTTAHDYLRVLWSTRLALPLVIETGTLDGRQHARTTVEPSARFVAPWADVHDYRRIDLSDLGD